MNRKTLRVSAIPAAALALALGLSACGAANESDDTPVKSDGISGTLNGGGASSQESAVAGWKQSFQTDHSGVTVNYDPVGSGGGREQFIAGGLDFAGSDSYLSDEEVAAVKERCSSDVVEVPTYVSPIAVIFNLDGVKELNLSAKTLGGIFEGTITNWNDPAIAEDNPDADLPDSAITPVHRSDDSGTTKNFTDYLDQASEGAWTGGVVETWPIKGGEAAEGTSGVVSAVTSGKGAIGYADASQAGGLSTVHVKVGDSFTEVSPEAAAKILEASTPVEGRSATDIAIEVDRKVTTEGVYPIVMVSYQMACQTYPDEAKANLVKEWLTFVTSPEGQEVSAKSAGAAPLSPSVSEKVAAAVATINAA